MPAAHAENMISKGLFVLAGMILGAVIGAGLGFVTTLGVAELTAASSPDDPSAWGGGSMTGLIFVPGGILIGAAAGAVLAYERCNREA